MYCIQDRYKGSLYKRSPYFVVTKLWDSVPDDTIELPDVFTFLRLDLKE